jgi:hypothetical protein
VFDGRHNQALLHEGTFTTSSSWCSSGSAADVSIDDPTLTATRRFTCAGGGDFTATVSPLRAEHGGSGSWQIVSGTGALADLRGKGTFTSVRLSGNAVDPSSITFRSTWDGYAGFDVTPPTVSLTRATAHKLKRPTKTYGVRLVLALADTGSDLVSYSLQVTDRASSTSLASRSGQTTTGAVTSNFRIKVPKVRRAVRISVDATDAVGNGTTFATVIRVP